MSQIATTAKKDAIIRRKNIQYEIRSRKTKEKMNWLQNCNQLSINKKSVFKFSITAFTACVSVLVFGQENAGAAFRTEFACTGD